MKKPTACRGPDCDRPARSKGLCAAHFQQLHRGKTLSPLRLRGPRECSFRGCKRPARSRGLCKSHYHQHWRGKVLAPLEEPGVPPRRKRAEREPAKVVRAPLPDVPKTYAPNKVRSRGADWFAAV